MESDGQTEISKIIETIGGDHALKRKGEIDHDVGLLWFGQTF